jgi:DNA-binding winged helix-turn-helix (wHTH) protein
MLILESTITSEYRHEEIKKILNLVLTGKFCQIVSIPGNGKATILKILAHNRNVLKFHLQEKEGSVRFIYLNLLNLTNYEDSQITKFLLSALDQKTPKTDDPISLTKQLNETINTLTDRDKTLIFLFDHFDEYQNRLPRAFFQMLSSANSLAKYKFAAVFATRRNLEELVDPQTLKDFYGFFVDNTIYLKVFNKGATEFLFSQIEQVFTKKLSQKDRVGIIAKTGGHAKLTKVCAELILRENVSLSEELLAKPIISATLFELWLFLTAQEQQVLIKIANKIPHTQDNILDNLIKFDLIKPNGTALDFTIPLLEEFIKTVIPNSAPQKITYSKTTNEIIKDTNVISDLLSPQEHRLLKFLIENQGKIIGREEIIKTVWPDAQVLQGVSDEAIDQMVFRLRKKIEDNPNQPKHILTIKGQGFRFHP